MDIKTIRFVMRLNQTEFASLTGLWQPRLSLIENGRVDMTKSEEQKISDFVAHSDIDLPFVEFVAEKRRIENAKHGY